MNSNFNALNHFIEHEFPKAISHPFENYELYKEIDVNIATENLMVFKTVCEKYDFKFLLMFGTLLGLYRDGGLIPYDSDVDVVVTENRISQLPYVLKKLATKGFKVVRYEKNGLVSVMKDGVYIDIYIFNKFDSSYNLNFWTLHEIDFTNPSTVCLNGVEFKTVNDIEKMLRKLYGPTWKTPIKGFSAGNFEGE